MKKFLTALMAIGMVLALAITSQAFTIYTSYGDFLAAFPNPTVENFEDTILQPGLSVVSTYPNAVIENGVYKDVVGGTNLYTTTWTNSQGFVAFGGWFDLANPGGMGTNILVTVADTSLVIGEIDRTYTGQFWGFSTGYAFNSVLFSEGTYNAFQETYWNVDLAYKTVPEPASMLLLGLGLLGMGLVSKKR